MVDLTESAGVGEAWNRFAVVVGVVQTIEDRIFVSARLVAFGLALLLVLRRVFRSGLPVGSPFRAVSCSSNGLRNV